MHNRQTQSGSLPGRLGGEKRLEDTFLNGALHSAARIRYGESHVESGLETDDHVSLSRVHQEFIQSHAPADRFYHPWRELHWCKGSTRRISTMSGLDVFMRVTLGSK